MGVLATAVAVQHVYDILLRRSAERGVAQVTCARREEDNSQNELTNNSADPPADHSRQI